MDNIQPFRSAFCDLFASFLGTDYGSIGPVDKSDLQLFDDPLIREIDDRSDDGGRAWRVQGCGKCRTINVDRRFRRETEAVPVKCALPKDA